MKFWTWIINRVGAANARCQQLNGLRAAGLDEQTLRRMDPDDRVAALENARLDPYDYIYLAC